MSTLHTAFARLDAATCSMDLVDLLCFLAKHAAFLRRLAQADQAVLMSWVCGRSADDLLVRALLALANTDAELVSLGGLRGSYAGHSLLLDVSSGKLLRQRHSDGRIGRSICEAQAAWDLAGYARPIDAAREAALYAAGEAGRDRRLQD